MSPRVSRRCSALGLVLALALVAGAAAAEEHPFAGGWHALDRERGRLGVRVTPMTAALREYFDIDGEAGVLVSEVEPASPAAAAGIEAGDVLLEVDSHAVDSPRELIRLVNRVPGGRKIEIVISRRGERRTVEVALRGEPRVPLRDYEERFRPWMDRTVDQIRRHMRELERRLEELERRLEAGDQATERT